VQILSPTAAPQGPAVDQRAQSPCPQERADASNGHGAGWPVRLTRTDTHYRKIDFCGSFVCFFFLIFLKIIIIFPF
jgi:hypothetical protein